LLKLFLKVCQCSTILHEVLKCDSGHLSLCTECQYLSDLSIKQCGECGLYRCVRYSLEAGKCVDVNSL
jgi:hypothetical protein